MIYEAKTKVYCTNLGQEFGTEISIQIVANSIDDAREQAERSFNRYVARLQKNHKNTFGYDYISIISPF